MEKKGILVQERTVSLGSDLLSCLGNTVSLNTHGILDKEPVAWNCSSPGGLQVTYEATEPDLNQDWDIVSHIRKTS